MGKRAFIPAWDGKAPVEGLTMVAPAPEPKAAPAVEATTPPAAPEATAPAAPVATEAPAAAPEKPTNPFAAVDPNLMGLAAVLMVRRLRELREEEKK